jgi:ABC-type molybdate transport system substrate-binding protein
VLVLALCASARAQDLIFNCAGAVKPAVLVLVPAWTTQLGHRVEVTYVPAGDLVDKLAAVGNADIVILPAEGLAAQASVQPSCGSVQVFASIEWRHLNGSFTAPNLGH